MQSSVFVVGDDAVFRKSSYSQSEAACVEVADLGGAAAVRDTSHRTLCALSFPGGEWHAFLVGTKQGESC
ncbi:MULTISPECIES: DUF397 domain-containing protein [Nocardiopsis]|uniref:DUF397 domain-containing protein n=1 Tax=Nocardiopsis sinuspersici TaxID=501010 RepID=A0A1V3BY45_9ACTN|nr:MULTISPECIES: DUF397 domain-containing protein [Nocardiopsis]OOC53368.1 hypothetical protein NOSIN_05715 [Nocardiopsis sinuspersici]